LTTASKRTKAPDSRQLLNAACSIVAESGWAGLTLRPLAESLAVSVTVLSNHYGARAEVVAAICAAACAEEERLFAGWRQMLARLGPLSAGIAADLADTIVEELAVRQRAFSLLFIEALQTSSWDDSLRSAFAPWLQARMLFWTQLGIQAGVPAAAAGAGWLGGYFIDELAHSLCLNHLADYRMLRRLCLRRLFSGIAAQPDSGDVALFEALFDGLEYRAGETAVTHGAVVAVDWAGRAARACALTLTERGVSALTHRAIAAEAGVPHTTLSYRFPTQHDLVVAGLEYIITHLLQAVDDSERSGDLPQTLAQLRTADGHDLDVGRATFALAIAAARMPRLVPSAADMRRRRGINLLKILRRAEPPLRGLDMPAAQVASVALIGYACTLPIGDAGQVPAVYGGLLTYLHVRR
jgi:AcrR family transcriptional regulator